MLHRYQIDLRVKEGNTEKTIKKSIFRKRTLTDTELEEAQLEFIRNTKALYKEKRDRFRNFGMGNSRV